MVGYFGNGHNIPMADRSYEKKKHKIKQAMNIVRLRDYNLI
jgi:hypothetical protein